MNVGQLIFEAHAGLAGGRITPNRFDEPDDGPPTWPAIRYTVITQDPDVTIDGTDTGDTDDYRVQVDYVDVGYDDAKALRDSGVAAMQDLHPPCVRIGGFETYDTETKTHRFVVEYLITPSSS